jgi:hypothetical protein
MTRDKKDCVTCGGDGCHPADMEDGCPSCGGTGYED